METHRPPRSAPRRCSGAFPPPTAFAACLVAALLLTATSCQRSPEPPTAEARAERLAASLAVMDETAREYVALVLELGTHDDGYVDAYYGPQEWRTAAEAEPRSVEQIGRRAGELAAQLATLQVPADGTGAGTPTGTGADAGTEADTGTEARPAGDDGDVPPPETALAELRRTFLVAQLEAVAARARMLGGTRMTFDQEAKALYGAEPPHHSEEHFAAVIAQVGELLPGDGPLLERYRDWREAFVIPPDRLDAVFQAAVEACRERTAAHLELPPDEGFRIEYVRDKPWSGYNWYQGDYQSLIQVNAGLPIYIDRALDLACHEGYPGHHVFNALLEKHMVRDRGWWEFSVYPLYSPQSLLAEGTANFGIRVAFPGEERVAFERDVLFPLAGLDPSLAASYYAVAERLEDLSYAGNEAARRYLDGDVDAAAAAAWLERYALTPPERAAQRVAFFDAYRSYVINYNLGQDLVRRWVEAQGGTADRPDERWEVFSRLLTTPRTPSGIAVQ